MSFSFAYSSTVNSETSLTCLEFCDMTNNCAASSHQEMVILNTGHKGMALANRNTRLGCDTQLVLKSQRLLLQGGLDPCFHIIDAKF